MIPPSSWDSLIHHTERWRIGYGSYVYYRVTFYNVDHLNDYECFPPYTNRLGDEFEVVGRNGV
ncbi:MAG: hypothetical protein HQL58_09495 [Magnetococcales bacterium]|nr:hypothetical protein [Magnetococcales bacterium]